MRRSIWVAGGVVTLLVLAGAAFVAGRLMSGSGQAGTVGVGGSALTVGDGADSASGPTMMLEVQRAEELPGADPEVIGVFARREDNRIFVNEATDGVITVVEPEDGRASVLASGPEVEIVLTGETTVYRDATDDQDLPPGGTVRQRLQPGSVEEIGPNSTLEAWGQRRGERLVARLLVYRPPPMPKR